MTGRPYRPMRRWRSVHTAVWLIGLAILAIKGWWWPGILVLAAISALVEAVLPRENAKMTDIDADEDSQLESQADVISGKTAAVELETNRVEKQKTSGPRLDLLPTNCPRCGAPLHGVDVKWTSDRSADCPFCGSHLPLKSE